MSEQVIHPAHYNKPGRKECWDEFIDRFGAKNTFVWCLMTAEKYLYRAGSKENNSEEQDIRKAFQYYNKAESIRDQFDEVKGYNNGLRHKVHRDLEKVAILEETV